VRRRENKRTFTEEDLTFHGDLISSVGSLRDPLAVDALMGAVATGAIVREALIQIAPASTPKLLAMADRDTSFVNRTAAIITLGQIVQRHAETREAPDTRAAILVALLQGLKEMNPFARGAAIGALAAFADDPRARTEIARLAREDPFRQVAADGRESYPNRERAASWLATHAKTKE